MSAEFFGINLTIPEYFHREYKNDVANQATVSDNQVLAFRVINTAIPFIGLYKPLNHPLSIGLGIYRSIVCLSQLRTLTRSDTKENISSQLINTATSITALTATIITPPLGMLITTVQDLIIEIGSLENYLSTGKNNQALESCVNIINNALYLSLFFIGGIELTIASLALQIMLGIYHGRAEFKKGNYIEASGQTFMTIFRCKQMADQVRLLQSRWKVNEMDEESPKEEVKKSFEYLKNTQIFPFTGIVEFSPKEDKKFQFYKFQITIINDTDHILKCKLFIDEGIPICAIIKSPEGCGSWGIHHALSPNGDMVVVIDSSWK